MDLNLEIRKSEIAGNGVFTKKPIQKFRTVYILSGELCTLEEVLKRVDEGRETPSDPLGIEDEKYLDLDEISRTFNHSCDPNTYVKGKSELVAMRNIPAGEEITYDYSTTMNDNEEKIKKHGNELWTCRCNCGSRNCRGIIDQFKNLPESQKTHYINNRFLPDFMLKAFH